MDYLYVRRMRLELTRRNRHYPLKVACLPNPPPAREKVPRTGLEPACLSTHAPETCASTNSAIPPKRKRKELFSWCPEQDSNLHASRHTHLKRARLPFRHLGIVFSRNSFLLLERKTRLELATLTLARLCSTN